MNQSIFIPSILTLLSTLLSIFFLSCDPGDASLGTTQSPLLAQAPGPSITVTGGPSNVAVGDMNKDGKPDLVVTSGQARTITVLLGGGSDAKFRGTGGNALTVADSPGEMVLRDLNGDTKLDLAFVSHDSYGVTLVLGDGKGGLAVAANSPIVMKQGGQHPHTHGLATDDLNRDGKLDLVTVNNADNDVSIAFGDGHGNFTLAPGSPFAVGPSPYPLALGDVNNDGLPDIVATSTATGPQRAQQLPFSRALTLLLADGRGGYRSSLLPLRTGQPWFVVIGDLNGDRQPDLVATHHERSALTVLLGDGSGNFKEVSSSPFDLGHDVWQMVLADVNRDGKLDVLAAAGDGVRVMMGDGRGGFTPAPHSPFLTGQGVWRIAVGDVNTDGKIDVITTNAESKTVGVLLGQ
ncbi:MAG: VCBS repeat-containing protein [Pyrinomonadaceae bacterium]|nr:VCBS repeat-containing protein [Pyrinomonadaceae bacterium]